MKTFIPEELTEFRRSQILSAINRIPGGSLPIVSLKLDALEYVRNSNSVQPEVNEARLKLARLRLKAINQLTSSYIATEAIKLLRNHLEEEKMTNPYENIIDIIIDVGIKDSYPMRVLQIEANHAIERAVIGEPRKNLREARMCLQAIMDMDKSVSYQAAFDQIDDAIAHLDGPRWPHFVSVGTFVARVDEYDVYVHEVKDPYSPIVLRYGNGGSYVTLDAKQVVGGHRARMALLDAQQEGWRGTGHKLEEVSKKL